MRKPPALLVSLQIAKSDPALQPRGRGARKLLVTGVLAGKEREATQVEWRPPAVGEECPVQAMANTEVALFTEQASQDRHYHEVGTEIYMSIEGTMTIEVEGEVYELAPGDMIVVNPGSIHEVMRDGHSFLCRVVTVNCGGASDKFLAVRRDLAPQ